MQNVSSWSVMVIAGWLEDLIWRTSQESFHKNLVKIGALRGC